MGGLIAGDDDDAIILSSDPEIWDVLSSSRTVGPADQPTYCAVNWYNLSGCPAHEHEYPSCWNLCWRARQSL